MILNFNEFLFESNNNLKYVYHIVDINKLNYILDNNKISSYKFQYISTTRDPNLNWYVGDSPTSLFKLELDYQKLSKDYDIKPFVYTSLTGVSMPEEEEEQIKTNEIIDVDKYITKIIIMKHKMERMKDTGWFKSGGGFYNKGRQNIPNLLKEIVNKSKYDIWIQDGEKIYKDDEYINSLIDYNIEMDYYGYAIYTIDKRDVEFEIGGKKQSFKRYVEYYTPADDRNEILTTDNLVYGYEYPNLYLMLKKPDVNQLNENEIILQFEIKIDNIINVSKTEAHVKEAKLQERYTNRNKISRPH